MRVLAIGDIGVVDSMVHIGDEAMFEQFLTEARARGTDEIVAMSSNPAESSQRYDIETVPRLGLSGDRLAMAAQAARAEFAVLETVDAVVIAGGGNLAAQWPIHLIERAEIARRAVQRGIPLIITGQTLGPELTPADERMLAELLGSAQAVGVRESPSRALAARLGVRPERLHQGADDASFLGLRDGEHPEARPYALVSLSLFLGAADQFAFVESVAGLLDSIAQLTGVEIVFHAHYGSLAAPWHRGDVILHEAVAERMSTPSRCHPVGTAIEAAHLAHGASLVVASRYHAAVFAAAAGVATLGITVDDYTTVKLEGALGAFGQGWTVSADALAEAPEIAARLWASRREIRVRGQSIAIERRQETKAWWDRVLGLVWRA